MNKNKNGGKEHLYQKALQHTASDNANFSKLAAGLAFGYIVYGTRQE